MEQKGNIMSENGFAPSEMVQALQANVERLQAELDESRVRHEARIEELNDTHRAQLDRMSNQTRHRDLQRMLEATARRQLIEHAKRQANTIGEVDQANRDDEFYLRTVRRAFEIARVLGFGGEASQLALELDHEDIWEEVRNDDSLLIDNDPDKIRKVLDIVTMAGHYPDSNRHPMSAEYQSLWREAFKKAKQAGLCDQYDTVAGYLGIPTEFELSWSGTVRVYVDGWFEFPTSGDAQWGTPDASEELDGIDIGDYIDQLDITAEFSELNYED